LSALDQKNIAELNTKKCEKPLRFLVSNVYHLSMGSGLEKGEVILCGMVKYGVMKIDMEIVIAPQNFHCAVMSIRHHEIGSS